MTPQQEEYRTIPLTKGQVAIVDLTDYEWLSAFNWWAQWQPRAQVFYAATSVKISSSPRTYRTILMHRMIMGLDRGDKRQVDHKERVSTLDNRRGNLRIATVAQNHWNARMPSHNTSGYKGVFWNTQKEKYQAVIVHDGKQHHLGFFLDPKIAFAAYCEAVRAYRGEFGRTDESCFSVNT